MAHESSVDRRFSDLLGRSDTSQLVDGRLERSRAWVRANLDRPIRAQDAAAEAGLDRSHYSRLFKRSYGITFHRWHTALRIRRAQKLLRRRDLTLEFIAAEVGFLDRSSLQRAFRRVLGITTTDYRNDLAGAAFSDDGDRDTHGHG